jgi:hypothetical protein
VKLQSSGQIIKVYRTVYKRISPDTRRYYKATFPLRLAYAVTGHKCQGMTIHGRVVLYLREVFCAGLLYVMLSRVLVRSQMFIVGSIHESMVKPIPLAPFFQDERKQV